MKFYGKRRNYRKKSAPKKRAYKKRTTVSRAVKQYVSRSIKVASENKITNWGWNNSLRNFNATASAWYDLNFHTLSPDGVNITIPQGTGQGQRIGNQVKTVKAELKLILIPRGYNATTNLFPKPLNIRIVIFSSKKHNVGVPNFSDFQNSLFQSGNASTGPDNTIQDMLQDINKDLFSVYYDKMVKLGYLQTSANGADLNQQYFGNNDYKMNIMRKINITKYLSKIYRFNDDSLVPQQGKSVFIMFIQTNCDGSTCIETAVQSNIRMELDYTFEE